jgi:hypothetical protein
MPQKSGRARAGMQPHINNPVEQVGLWAMNEQKWLGTTILINLFIESVHKQSYHNDLKHHLKLNTLISAASIGARLRDLLNYTQSFEIDDKYPVTVWFDVTNGTHS